MKKMQIIIFLFKISKKGTSKLPNVYFVKGYFFWKYMNLSYEFFTKKWI